MTILLEQRRDEILQAIEQKGFVSLSELVTRFEISESTIRRDLEHLDGTGQIRRTRGERPTPENRSRRLKSVFEIRVRRSKTSVEQWLI